jgi:5-formyltetrahydrofolate cyclo-ligase
MVASNLSHRSELRIQLRHKRRSLSRQQQQVAATNIFRQIKHQLVFLRSKHIAFYLPNDGEISPTQLITYAQKLGKCCYLPVISPHTKTTLWFSRYTPSTRLYNNRFGIPEPSHRSAGRISAKHLDLVFMPLVGFDSRGGRIGMGGGFYDRTFAFRSSNQISKPRLIGLAHNCQEVDRLPLASWDIPLDDIVTDTQCIAL